MRKIILDIETKNTFQTVGSNDPAALDISLLVVYDYSTDQYTSYLEEDFPKLWPLIESADLLIGYNSDHFDIPLLNKYYIGDLTQKASLDLLVEIKNVIGRRIRLDAVAGGTLGKKKIGNGLEAITWWQNKEIEKVRKYCEEDVRITKEIHDYAVKHQKLKYRELNEIHEFPINTSGWENKSSTAYTPPLF